MAMRQAIRPEELTKLNTPMMYANPYPRYAYLRENHPVSRVRTPLMVRGTGYMLTRYADVYQMHTDDRFSNNTIANGGGEKYQWLMPSTLKLLSETMVFKDDPDHKRLRTLVHKAFTPKLIMGMSDQIQATTDQLLDEMERKSDVDLISDFAVKLPLAVIAGMLGVNDTDRDDFHRWVNALSDAAGAGPIGMIKTMPTARKILNLFQKLADDARANPDDGLVSGLIQANEDGDKLTEREILAMIFVLLLAGHDTTSNLIGNSTLALYKNPEQQTLLREDASLMPSALEELLRYTTPVACGATRVALEDIEIGGSVIPQGGQVLGMIISANRDEEVFDDPEALDLTRTPNKHLAFSFGNHYCLGHQLARLEGKIAMTSLLERFKNIELAVPESSLRYKPTPSLRGFGSMPVRVS